MATRLAISAWLLVGGWSCGGASTNHHDAAFDAGTALVLDAHSVQSNDGGEAGRAALSIFDAWRELREAIRKSPDHLVAQADLAVATRDPQKILDFVSQNIQTIPATATSIGGVTSMRWGTRATLRGGAGTMREKAELLAGLYAQAEFTARVMAVSVSNATTLGPRLLAPLPRPAFDPPMDDASLARWQAALGVDPTFAPAPKGALDYSQADALANLITPLLQSDAGAQPMGPQSFDWTRFLAMPVVQVTVNGSPTYANPAVAGTRLGDMLSPATPGTADPPAMVGTMQVKLEGVTNARPAQRVLLAQGNYAISDLIGRQLVASFVPAVSPEKMFTATIGSVDGFYPVLGVRGVGMTADQTAALAQAGTLINRSGDVLTQTSTGTTTIDGQPLGAVISQADAVARVSKVEITSVNATAFPRVEVRARALDAAGLEVPGVPAAAIAVAEAGTTRPLVVLQNAAAPPRVLFVLDTSTSMPAEFLGAQAASVVRDMAAQLLAIDARSQFAVAAVQAGLTGLSAWLSDPAALETAAGKVSGTASDLWRTLDAASGTGASVVVLISDGQADSQPTDAELSRIVAGPPAILLKVGTGTDNSFQQTADITGGARFEVADANSAATAVSNTLQRLQKAPLIVAYQALGDNTSAQDASACNASSYEGSTASCEARSFVLTIGQAPGASTSYTVPAQRAAPPAWAGFYLTLDDGNQQVTRVLGGQIYPDANTIVPQSAIDEALDAIYGQYVVSFEAGAPSTGEWLDDVLSAKIALEQLSNAVHGGTDSDILAALKQQGLPEIPEELPVLHAPLPSPTDGTLTFETGPRVVLLSAFPHPTRGIVRHADILPFTQFATVGGATPVDNFARTLSRSSILAVAEQQIYDESTLGLLRGRALKAVAPNAIGSPFPTLGSSEQDVWQTRLALYWNKLRIVPEDGKAPAFFSVDPRTGSLLAILSDGSGGGLSASDQGLANGTLGAINLISLAASFGGASFGFGCIVALEIAILKVVVAEAGMVAQIGPDAVGDSPFSSASCGLACSYYKKGMLLPVPSPISKIISILGLLGYSYNCGCPK